MPGKALWGLQFTKNRWQSYRLPWVSGSAHITMRSHKQAVSAAAKARIHSAHAGPSIDTNLNEPMGLAHGHSAVTPAGGWAQQRRGQG